MPYSLPSITSEEITFLSDYIYDLCGIKLGPEKSYLFENRFALIMEEMGCNSFAELYYLSKNRGGKVLERRLVDAISTHETFFFRDNTPFELLKKKLIPEIIDWRNQQERSVDTVPMPLSIWSTACSTGQEVYSLAIILKELLGSFERYSIKLLGSDISEKALLKATSGKYNDFEMNRGLTTERTQRFFIKKDGKWQVNDEIRGITSFRKVNLIKSFHGMDKFDIILCRNVAVYFPQADRYKLFEAIARSMHSKSYLVLGSTESLADLNDLFVGTQYMGASYYQLRSHKGKRSMKSTPVVKLTTQLSDLP